MLLKLCEVILPSVRFSGFFQGCTMVDFTNFLAEKKYSQKYVVLYTEINGTFRFD